MRAKRFIGNGRSYYHVVSRVVDKRKIFSARDKEVFCRILRNLETFAGVRVVTYCVMSNHFHLLLEIPERETLAPLDEAGLLGVLPLLYDGDTVEGVRQELERARLSEDEGWHAAILARYEYRRGSLSFFLKDLKQRITAYMNRRLDRSGTLWEGRFKSVLVEGGEQALLTVAAYIDLNPIRAGLVKRPEDYRWCGYAEAVSGSRGSERARSGLGSVLADALQNPYFRDDWAETQARYRVLLYDEGRERSGGPDSATPGRPGFAESEVEAVVKEGGNRSVAEVLRQRVRYFCDGAVLGSTDFVEAVFSREQARRRFGPKRKTGARRMRGADWGSLRVLRDLQKEVIGE